MWKKLYQIKRQHPVIPLVDSKKQPEVVGVYKRQKYQNFYSKFVENIAESREQREGEVLTRQFVTMLAA